MRNTQWSALFCVTAALGLMPTNAVADVFSCTSLTAGTNCWQPSPVDLNDLDHHSAYTWRIDNISLPTNSIITSATLAIKNIANWDNSINQLFIHLLDTADEGGVKSYIDNRTDWPRAISDAFEGWDLRRNPLVNGTKPENKVLDEPLTYDSNNNGTLDSSFGPTPQNYVYTFTATQLEILRQFISNGNDLAFGFDPDCHFYNDGVTFQIATTTPVLNTVHAPEPGSILLLLTVAGGVALAAHRKRRSA